MSFAVFLNIFFLCFVTVTSLLVVTARNPIFSVLFLILTYLAVSILLFMLQLDFVPVVILVIYVGAVAILFIFAIMALNIKLANLKNTSQHLIPFIAIYFIAFMTLLFVVVKHEYTVLVATDSTNFVLDNNHFGLLFNDELLAFLIGNWNIKLIGTLLFTNYYLHFEIAGFGLLIGMIGATVLILEKRFVSKTQSVQIQVLRNHSTAIKSYVK